LPADNRGQGVQDHTWDINSGSNSPTGIWFNLYNVINRANRILNIIDGIPAQTASEELQKDRIKAECLGLRALSHFDLLRSFGVSYDGDSSELGVPNIDYVVVLQQPSRNTVAENYNFINTDINAALGLLDASYTDNTRLTVNALNALQARVSLYQGDYATAISAASQVISNVPLATATEYPDIWTDASENEVVFKLKRTTGDGAAGTLFQDTNGDVFFTMSNDMLFRLLATSAGDPRFGVCLDLATATIAVPTIGKYLGTAANFGLNDIKVFRTSEMVCIRSEAYARTGELALSAADMNLLGVNRGYAGTGSFATTAEALSIIEDVRRIELAFEGHRYYDMRRYGKSIDRTPTDDCGAASGACQLPATDHRWVMPIPQDEIFANDNITQNPGY
jgi:hypothetical protein